MISGIEYAALGVVATLLGAFVAQHIGIIQISLMHEAHTLNVLKAMPRIGTSIDIDERHDNGPGYPPFIYLKTTIYNEGELSVAKLKGDWKLTSTYGIANNVIPLWREILGTVPYQLQPYKITESGMSDASKSLRFNIDIQFDYSGIADNEPYKYSAKYAYDPKSKQMIKEF